MLYPCAKEEPWSLGLFELAVLWMGAEVIVAEQKSVVAPAAFLLGEATGEVVVDVLGSATQIFPVPARLFLCHVCLLCARVLHFLMMKDPWENYYTSQMKAQLSP